MKPDFDEALRTHARVCGLRTLMHLYHTLAVTRLYIPVAAPLTELRPGAFDVPAVCVRGENGKGYLLAFSTVDNLRRWKPTHDQFVTFVGAQVAEMAKGMDDVDEIAVNVATPESRGNIPRADFEFLQLPHVIVKADV